ncbi:hypothetical protein CLOM_g2949 [Closterium sp. NIES-68]|nr:hypothetical protein CLOM_g2949 [Closterium sp. NIES-68]
MPPSTQQQRVGPVAVPAGTALNRDRQANRQRDRRENQENEGAANMANSVKRREVRNHLRGLQAQVAECSNRNELSIGSSKFEEILDKANKLTTDLGASRDVKVQMREKLMDADVLDGLSQVLSQSTDALVRCHAATPEQFVAALRKKYLVRPGLCGHGGRGGRGRGGRGRGRGGAETEGGEDEGEEGGEGGGEGEEGVLDWVQMGRDFGLELVRPAWTIGTMLGPMEAEAPKRRAAGVRRKREAVGATVVPAQLNKGKGKDGEGAGGEGGSKETATEGTVKEMYRRLKRAPQHRVQLPHLLLSRSSFAHTVENMFALSFLVKEGRVGLRPNPVSGATVDLRPPAPEPASSSGQANGQFVMRLDINDWKKLCQSVPEGDEVMSARMPRGGGAGEGGARAAGGAGEAAEAGGADGAFYQTQQQHEAPVRKISRNRARETESRAGGGVGGGYGGGRGGEGEEEDLGGGGRLRKMRRMG